MRGLCVQKHFSAVSQPFKVLFAPWAPAILFFALAFVLSIFSAAIFGTSVAAIVMVLGVLIGHGLAIAVGMKMQYIATIITGIESRRTGSTNLSSEKTGNYDFSNI